jgi:hypothetical protein
MQKDDQGGISHTFNKPHCQTLCSARHKVADKRKVPPAIRGCFSYYRPPDLTP